MALALAALALQAQEEAGGEPAEMETTQVPENTFKALGFVMTEASGLTQLEFSAGEASIIADAVETRLSGANTPMEVAEKVQEARPFLRERFEKIQAGEPVKEPSEIMLTAIGYVLCENRGVLLLEPSQEEAALIADGVEYRLTEPGVPVNISEAMRKVNNFLRTRGEEVKARNEAANLERGEAFLAEIAEKEGVQKDPMGFYFEVLEPGGEPHPTMDDTVLVHYTGELIDGTVFDSSRERGEPTSFPMNRVVPGFSGGLTKIGAGGRVMIYIPPDLGYGARDAGAIPPNSTLIFDVELLEINPNE